MLGMRHLLSCLAAGLAASVTTAAVAAEPNPQPAVPTLTLFGSLPEAQKHCPNDIVVQLVLPEGFYLHGDRGFGGSSLDHVFLCANEAEAVFAWRKLGH